MSWKCMCLKSTWWLKIYLSTRRAKQKTHTIDVETFLFESEILFEHRSNYKAIEIGAIKFRLRFTFAIVHVHNEVYVYFVWEKKNKYIFRYSSINKVEKVATVLESGKSTRIMSSWNPANYISRIRYTRNTRESSIQWRMEKRMKCASCTSVKQSNI